MIGKVLVGAVVSAGALIALARTERGRELLEVADEKLRDLDAFVQAKVEEREQERGEAAEQLEEAVRKAAERAAKLLGLNVEDMQVHVKNATSPKPEPEPGPSASAPESEPVGGQEG